MGETDRGRTAARLSFLGVLLVLGVAAALSREVIVEHYCLRLRRSPGFVLEALQSPERGLKRAAIERFADTGPGRKRLLALYLQGLEQAFSEGPGDSGGAWKVELPQVWKAMIGLDGKDMWWFSSGPVHWQCLRIGPEDGRTAGLPMTLSVLQTIHQLLARRLEIDVQSSDHPRLRFQFIPAGRARELWCPEALPQGLPRGRTPVCLVTRNPGRPVAELARELASEDTDLRRDAALDLLSLGTGATDAIPALIGAVADRHSIVERAATIALHAMVEKDPPPEVLFANLLDALGHQDPNVRWFAAEATGKLGARVPGARRR